MTLILMVGAPGTGKSTISREMAKKGFIIVNDDSLVLSLHAGDYTLYKNELNSLYKSIEHSIIIHALLAGQKVVIDRPNTKPDTRQRYIQIAKAYNVDCHALVFPFVSVEEHAKRRFYSDPRGLTLDQWIEACKRIHKDYQPPHIMEGFTSVSNISDMKDSYDFLQNKD